MSRHGYTDDCDDQWAHIRWRGQVASAFRGARGQKFLRELIEALDEMPIKELHSNVFNKEGCQCTLGVIGAKRGLDMSDYEPDEFGDSDNDPSEMGPLLGIASQMAQEIMWHNDEMHYVNPADRWRGMRKWLAGHLIEWDAPVAVMSPQGG